MSGRETGPWLGPERFTDVTEGPGVSERRRREAAAEPDPLVVEGLAGQLYSVEHATVAWWHLMREDIKERYRKQARAKIAKFDREHRGI